MGSFSIWHWIVVLVVVLILFGGGGKLSRLMGDAARGINAFKKGLKEEGSADSGEASENKALRDDASETVTEDVKKDEAAKG